MIYVVLSKDVRSAEGKLYAKKGKQLKMLFRNKNHYICEVGKYSVPVFAHQVECETTVKEEEDEKTKEVTEGMEIEGGKIGNTNLDELFERLRSDERARWKEKIKAMIETYGKYAKNEKHVVESANMLSDANAVMYKLEKGADFLNKKKEKVN